MRRMSENFVAPATLGLALALFAAGPAGADDAEIQSRIEKRFAKAELGRDTDIEIRVKDGVVHLEGIALSLKDSREAERAARKEAKTVINQIRVFPERPRSDRKIKKDAEKAIYSYARYGVFDAVELDVESGLVSLHGFVLDDSRRRALEERLARIDGVRDVHNDLRLQGRSPYDEQLRRELYARIYNDPLFEQYASWAEPPVRIFVDRGQVTLAGTVASRVEQTALGFMARESMAFRVQNFVQVESEKKVPEEDSPRDEG
jgi:osmotically-inducible protein OsmY